MANSSTGGDVRSSTSPPPTPTHSSPNPPPVEESPRRGSGGDDAPRGSPKSPQRPPAMGVPGQSAFSPYKRPPQPHFPSPSKGPSGSGGPSSAGGIRLQGAQAVPVGGGGSGGAASPGALRIGGSPAARKRLREGSAGAAGAAGGNPPGEVPANAVSCSVCGKVFPTAKALFGHMRSHPGRGWKGAHPPPVFRAEEEFADLHVEVAGAAAADGGAVEAAGRAEEAEEAQYRLPDLNNPPPEESE